MKKLLLAVLVSIGFALAATPAEAQGPIFVQGKCRIYAGAGTPEAAVAAPVCSVYLRTNGGASTILYVKETGTGNTGWVAYGAGGGGGGLTSPVGAADGGTGQTSYTIGDLLFASGTTALSKLAAGTNNYFLKAAGAGVAPAYFNLFGTANTWSAIQTFTPGAKIGTCQLTAGTGSPQSVVTGSVCDLFLRTDGGAATTLYVKESGTASNTGWAAVGGGGGGGLTSPVAAVDGGTGQTVYAVGNILYASSTTALSKLAAGTNGDVLTLASGLPSWAAPSGGGGGASLSVANTWTANQLVEQSTSGMALGVRYGSSFPAVSLNVDGFGQSWIGYNAEGNSSGAAKVGAGVGHGQAQIIFEPNGGGTGPQFQYNYKPYGGTLGSTITWNEGFTSALGVLASPNGFRVGPGTTGGCTLTQNTYNPNGNQTGNICDMYLRTNGGAGDVLYIKEGISGVNYGWVAIGSNFASKGLANVYTQENMVELGSIASLGLGVRYNTSFPNLSLANDGNAMPFLMYNAKTKPSFSTVQTYTTAGGHPAALVQFEDTSSNAPQFLYSYAAGGTAGADITWLEGFKWKAGVLNTAKFQVGTSATGCLILSGAGSPETVVTGKVCDFYLRTDGGANTTMYVKESGAGNTGWIAK